MEHRKFKCQYRPDRDYLRIKNSANPDFPEAYFIEVKDDILGRGTMLLSKEDALELAKAIVADLEG